MQNNAAWPPNARPKATVSESLFTPNVIYTWADITSDIRHHIILVMPVNVELACMLHPCRLMIVDVVQLVCIQLWHRRKFAKHRGSLLTSVSVQAEELGRL